MAREIDATAGAGGRAKIDVSRLADIRAYLGASGSGKSTQLKRDTAKAGKLVVWDIEDEWGGQCQEVSLANLAQAMRAKAYRLRVVPGLADLAKAFDLFCGIVFHTGDCVCVVEELKFVTSPSWAPPWWAGLSLRGRKRGVYLRGASQRPAQIDKDFLGNCTHVWCGTLDLRDAKVVSQSTGVPAEDYTALDPLDWILFEKKGKKITRGRLTFG